MFIPFLNGTKFVIVYFIYCILVIALYKIYKKNNKLYDTCGESLTEEEYFMLNNSFEIEAIFKFYTMRLYARQILVKEGRKIKAENPSDNLNIVEKEVYKLFLKGFMPKDFRYYMVDKNLLKKYYNDINDELSKKHMIMNKEEIHKYRVIKYTAIAFLLIPGILRFISGLINHKPVAILSIYMIFLIISLLIFFPYDKSVIITEKGRTSSKLFLKNYELLEDNFYNNTL